MSPTVISPRIEFRGGTGRWHCVDYAGRDTGGVDVPTLDRSTEFAVFLFTHVEDSTRLWKTEPSIRVDAIRRPDTISRAATEGRGGRVFKPVGDAFAATFDRVLRAGEAAALDDLGMAAHEQGGFQQAEAALMELL